MNTQSPTNDAAATNLADATCGASYVGSSPDKLAIKMANMFSARTLPLLLLAGFFDKLCVAKDYSSLKC